MPSRTIYKIMTAEQWETTKAAKLFRGSADDLRDGYIHLSTAAQVAETARRHFSARSDLVLVAIDAASVAENLRFEPSRGGNLFPHLFAPLPVTAVQWAIPLPFESGRHLFPDLEP